MKHTLKVIILVFPLMLIAQRSSSLKGQSVNNVEWTQFREKIERAVQRGDLTKKEADEKYSQYRSKMSGKTNVRQDPVIVENFKKLGVDDLNELKNNMLDKGIPAGQLDAVLGGMLRLVHAARTDGDKFEMNPRIETYFKDRLELTNFQIDYLIDVAKSIANLTY